MNKLRAYLDTLNSWLATITIACTDYGVCAISFSSLRHVSLDLTRRRSMIIHSSKNELLEEAKNQIAEYLMGKRRRLNIPLDIIGSPFQRRVWNETMKIPYGETRSYSEIAMKIGKRLAYRAVGLALGSNPTVILIPCHRVVRKSGELGGFGGGIHLKRKLIELERLGRPPV